MNQPQKIYRPSVSSVPVMPPHGMHRYRLGALGQITGNPTIDGIIESPFTWGLAAVALFAAWQLSPTVSRSGGGVRISRRSTVKTSATTTMLLALGAGAAGYLLGQYGNQAGL